MGRPSSVVVYEIRDGVGGSGEAGVEKDRRGRIADVEELYADGLRGWSEEGYEVVVSHPRATPRLDDHLLLELRFIDRFSL